MVVFEGTHIVIRLHDLIDVSVKAEGFLSPVLVSATSEDREWTVSKGDFARRFSFAATLQREAALSRGSRSTRGV